MNIQNILFLFMAGFFSCVGNIFLKMSSKHSEFSNSLVSLINGYLLGGIIFYVLNLFFFVLALKTVPVSIAYPFLSTVSFVFLTVSGYLFLKEELLTHQYLGIFICVIGISLLVLER